MCDIKYLTRILIGLLIAISTSLILSCDKEEEDIDFDLIISALFPESDSVNYIFPPNKYRITLNVQKDIICYYTLDGSDPSAGNGMLYKPETGILLDTGNYKVKVVLYHDGVQVNSVVMNTYTICRADVINLIMTSEQEKLVYDSRDVKIDIDNPMAEFTYNGKKYTLDRLSTRGESTLNYRRKSFSVHLDEKILIEDREYSGAFQVLKDFKLVSMVHDYTYIENRIAIGLLQKVNLWNLFFKYVEVRINDHTQGVYMLVEDPEDYATDRLGSEYVLRRGYQGAIYKFEYKPMSYLIPENEYIRTYNHIYSFITLYNDEALYDSLASIMNIDSYFRKMAVDYLLKNGDLTDEIYLYAQVSNGNIYYQIIPWDYDDIFAENPHEIGRDWGVGKLFGVRSYQSMDDVINDVGDRLIFSIEDDLDYIIAKDDYLYSKYKVILKEVINDADDNCISSIFSGLKKELKPFYENAQIIEQSAYDRDPASYELYVQNCSDKLDFIIQRRAEILSKLNDIAE